MGKQVLDSKVVIKAIKNYVVTKDSNEYDRKKIISKKSYKGHQIQEVLLRDGSIEFWVYTDGMLDWEAGSLKEAKDFIDTY